jgi:hypothetical protein
MTDENSKMCRDCGCLTWRQPLSSQRYGYDEYWLNDDGSYDHNFEEGDDSGDWDNNGDPECAECASTDLEDLSDLTTQQFQTLYNIIMEGRINALGLIRAGRNVDPISGEEILTKVRRPRRKKGRLIGAKVKQR